MPMPAEFPEPEGYTNIPTFVKSNPDNNASYLDKSCELYPEWSDLLKETDAALEALIPGYNISQIKDKFGGLRYYIDIPDEFMENEEIVTKAHAITMEAEQRSWNEK